jgi:hypothetical protein
MRAQSGRRGIRTPERVTPLAVFKTAAFVRSAILPQAAYLRQTAMDRRPSTSVHRNCYRRTPTPRADRAAASPVPMRMSATWTRGREILLRMSPRLGGVTPRTMPSQPRSRWRHQPWGGGSQSSGGGGTGPSHRYAMQLASTRSTPRMAAAPRTTGVIRGLYLIGPPKPVPGARTRAQ